MSGRVSVLALILAAAVLAAASLCLAAGQPVLLQRELRQPDKIWVGQRLDLSVTLLTTTSFAGVPRFDLPQDAGLAIIADDAHPLLGTKNIDGVSYIFKQYDISLFPLRPGTLSLPTFSVEFGYLGDAGQTLDATLFTSAAQITVQAVPGADPKLPLVTATDLKVEDSWTPNPDKAAVGDAFTRRITLRATGMPGMALPPLKVQAIDGLAIYAGQPLVGTDTARGDYIGNRVEPFSLVCQKAGTYTLPEMRIQWWNPITEALREATLPPVTLQVMPDPLLESKGSADAAGGPGMFASWRWIGGGLIVLGAATLFMALWCKNRKRAGRNKEIAEKELFRQFERAAASNAAEETMRTLTRWFDAAGRPDGRGSLSGLISTFGDSTLQRQFDALEASVYSKRSECWSGMILSRRLAGVRKRYLRRRGRSLSRLTLGPLNP